MAGYPGHYNRAFASFSILLHPAIGMPCGKPALSGQRKWVPTFCTVDPMDDVGASWTPVVRQFRAGSYETCTLTTCHSHWGAAFDLVILVGLFSVTARADIHVLSPYHPSLALNGGGFPEGFSCRHSNPIRCVVVRGASHQPHSVWHARPCRDRQEHAGYYCSYLNTLDCATSCRTLTIRSARAGFFGDWLQCLVMRFFSRVF
jgi:hypothetical protein